MQIKIERNIPIPSRTGPGRKKSPESELALSMRPGDSVFCPDHKVYKRITKTLWHNNLKYVSRACDGGWRVWRIDGRTKRASVTKTFVQQFAKQKQLSNGRVAPTL